MHIQTVSTETIDHYELNKIQLNLPVFLIGRIADQEIKRIVARSI